jgi:hypothetical protein
MCFVLLIFWWHGHLGRVFHGLEARATSGNRLFSCLAKHIQHFAAKIPKESAAL